MRRREIGFVLAETLIVSTVVLTTLVLIYAQFRKVNTSYNTAFRYNTVDSLYAVNNVKEYIQTENQKNMLDGMSNDFVDITDCSSQYYIENMYCESLYSRLGVKKVIIAKGNLKSLKQKIYNINSFSNNMKEFISRTADIEEGLYHLMVEFTNGTIGSLMIRLSDVLAPLPSISRNFAYTGNYQVFEVSFAGVYKMELWGASGRVVSSSIDAPGKGAYVSGEIRLNVGDKFYIYVGEKGDDVSIPGNLSFNGGGETHASSASYGKGGGATDVRLVAGTWNDTTGLNSRIMVAGGGGSGQATGNGTGGNAGGLTSSRGSNSSGNAAIATQTTGHSFGYGRGGYAAESFSGGGGGYYGGGATSAQPFTTAGGSSYISGHTGCVAITSVSSRTPKSGCADGTTNIDCSYHYSGLVFMNTVMKSGGETFVSPGGTNETGHMGNGHARITLISR